MKVIHLKRAVFTAAIGLSLSVAGYAEGPLWEYSAPTPARVIVSSGSTATVHYTVTNHSHRSKNLKLQETAGLSASPCYLATKGSECTLTLTINGSLIPKEGIHSGPVLCEQGNSNQCYPPGEGNLLHITRSERDLELSQHGVPVSSLALSSGDVGTLVLKNTGLGDVSSLSIHFPFGWQSYFTNNCPALLAPQQSCSIVYTIPTPSAVGILNPLTIEGVNNRIAIPVSIQTMGAVKCWGWNLYGQLGAVTNSGTDTDNNSPLDVQALSSGVVSITGGIYHTCALLETGAVKCWGNNSLGQLGSTTNSGTTTDNNSPLDVQALSSGVVSITGGTYHTCALLDTGAVKCWGWNLYGQLGATTNSGTDTANNSPLDVQTLSSRVVSITGGDAHTCALLDTGAVKCWGLNNFGQLGATTNSETTTANNSPLDVQALSSGVVSIAAGSYHTCALLDTGAVKCWGWNRYGQLGSTTNSETNTANNSPLDVQGLSSGVVSITGGIYHTCALLDTGALKCWGNNRYGQLGATTNSGTDADNNSPLDVQALSSGVVSITGGTYHTCVLLDTGALKCWGYNVYGQLGAVTNSGTDSANNSPLGVQALSSGVLGILNHNLGFQSCAIVAGP